MSNVVKLRDLDLSKVSFGELDTKGKIPMVALNYTYASGAKGSLVIQTPVLTMASGVCTFKNLGDNGVERSSQCVPL